MNNFGSNPKIKLEPKMEPSSDFQVRSSGNTVTVGNVSYRVVGTASTSSSQNTSGNSSSVQVCFLWCYKLKCHYFFHLGHQILMKLWQKESIRLYTNSLARFKKNGNGKENATGMRDKSHLTEAVSCFCQMWSHLWWVDLWVKCEFRWSFNQIDALNWVWSIYWSHLTPN